MLSKKVGKFFMDWLFECRDLTLEKVGAKTVLPLQKASQRKSYGQLDMPSERTASFKAN